MTHPLLFAELIERDAELSAIDSLLDTACGGQGSLLVITGEAGIGKTCLIREARAHAEAAGMHALSARGAELEHDFPFGIVRQLFEPLLATASDSERAELLSGPARFADSALGDRLLTGGTGESDASYATLHGLYWLVVNASSHRPLLLAIDDAQWSDPPSQRWLAHLTKRIEDIPALVVLAVGRPEPGSGSELLDELTFDPVAHVLRPAPLGESGVGRLVRASLSPAADEEFCRACHAATQGNPFLLRELLTELAFERVAPSAQNAPRVPTVGPKMISRLVLNRLAGTSAAATKFAHAAAVVGDGAEVRRVGELAGLDHRAAAQAAHALVEIEILRDVEGIAFAHPIVRTAIYADLALPEREHAHALVARMLHAEGAPPTHIATHLLAAERGGEEWVVESLREAARAAMTRGSPGEAARYLRRALAEPPPVVEHVEVLVELGRAEFNAGGVRGLEHLEEACKRSDSSHRRAELALEVGRSLATAADWHRAEGVLDHAMSELGSADPELGRELEVELASVQLADLATSATAKRSLARMRGEPRGELRANPTLLASLAVIAAAEGSRDEAVRLADSALAANPPAGHADGHILAMIGNVLAWTGQFARATDLWNDVLAVARRRGSVPLFATASCFRSDVACRIGLIRDAEGDARAALEALDPAAWGRSAAVYPLAFLVEALIERAELTAAEDAIKSADIGRDLPELAQFNRFLFARGLLRLAQGRFREGTDDLLECGRRLDAFGVRNPAVMAWRSRAAGGLYALDDRTGARRLTAEELALARRFASPVAIGVALRAAALTEDDANAIQLLQEAVTVLEGSHSSIELARALVDLGAALRRKGRRVDARGPLRDGRDLALRGGAASLAQRAHEELVAAGARPRREMSTGASALTASEDRVARMAMKGLTNREIAQALFVTEKTVEMHLRNAYQKLGINSRSQLARSMRED